MCEISHYRHMRTAGDEIIVNSTVVCFGRLSASSHEPVASWLRRRWPAHKAIPDIVDAGAPSGHYSARLKTHKIANDRASNEFLAHVDMAHHRSIICDKMKRRLANVCGIADAPGQCGWACKAYLLMPPVSTSVPCRGGCEFTGVKGSIVAAYRRRGQNNTLWPLSSHYYDAVDASLIHRSFR